MSAILVFVSKTQSTPQLVMLDRKAPEPAARTHLILYCVTETMRESSGPWSRALRDKLGDRAKPEVQVRAPPPPRRALDSE